MRALWLIALAGCNQVFGLEPTELVDAAPPDRDRDGILDHDDNCPDGANTDQADLDRDGIGNVCDNCLLVANTTQADLGDGDMIGDACDPHPTLAGDCLVLQDTFLDPGAFARSWKAQGDNPEIIAEPGHARVIPKTTYTAQLVALDEQGMVLLGAFDIIALAETHLETGAFFALTSGASMSSGYLCGVAWIGYFAFQLFWLTETGGPGHTNSSSAHVTNDLLVRLVVPSSAANVSDVRCRAEWGVAAEYGAVLSVDKPGDGASGFRYRSDPFDLYGIQLFRFQTGTCPPPIVR
jgi:hypothetical protein